MKRCRSKEHQRKEARKQRIRGKRGIRKEGGCAQTGKEGERVLCGCEKKEAKSGSEETLREEKNDPFRGA